MAPTAGLEPATSKLTASCSTIELRRNTRAIIPLPLWYSQRLLLEYIFYVTRVVIRLFVLRQIEARRL